MTAKKGDWDGVGIEETTSFLAATSTELLLPSKIDA
jgi:hypothetical protein